MIVPPGGIGLCWYCAENAMGPISRLSSISTWAGSCWGWRSSPFGVAHRRRNREVGQGDPGGQHQGGVRPITTNVFDIELFSQVRIGGTGVRAAQPVSGDMLHSRAYGWQSAG